jgi:hypothetical protein
MSRDSRLLRNPHSSNLTELHSLRLKATMVGDSESHGSSQMKSTC